MRESHMWYDTCQVCHGARTVPCNVCSGAGNVMQTERQLVGASASAGTGQRTAVPTRGTCTDCRGTGAITCTACHGRGLHGTPAYLGPMY